MLTGLIIEPVTVSLLMHFCKGLGKLKSNVQVLVMSASKDMQADRIRLASELWSRGIAAEFGYKANPFMPEQMSYATSSGIPICVVLRPDELKQVSLQS